MLRRAKPLLGTLVEITCEATDAADTCATFTASQAGFAAVTRVHALMSRHEATSEVCQLNAARVGQWLAVSPDTLAVFVFSSQLSAQTHGAFDVFSARTPHSGGSSIGGSSASGLWQSLEIDAPGSRLRKHAPLQADLGGVAKGYAVDVAVAALQQAGMRHGWVNAGGDLRVFGDMDVPMWVRAPRDVSQLLDCARLRNAAAATSADYESDGGRGDATDGAAVNALRHGQTGHRAPRGTSWTVTAPSAMVADALTKLVAVTGDVSHPLLAHYAAQAWMY